MSREETSAHHEVTRLHEFEGTYVGFGPSDESAVGVGEMEIVIDGDAITTRWATGLEIIEYTEDVATAQELTPSEFDQLFPNPDPSDDEEFPPSSIFKVGILCFIFFEPGEHPEQPRLMVMGSMGDILGPTVLFSPEQVEQGIHEKVFSMIEEEAGEPNGIPRLANGGVILED